MLDQVWQALAATGYGVVSALVPIFNAEAYAAVAGAAGSWPTALVAVLGLALGQTTGKLIIYEAAGRGGKWWGQRFARGAEKERDGSKGRRWWDRAVVELARPRTATPLLVAAGVAGVPPLAMLALAAGVAGTNRVLFVAVCFAGRAVRFGLCAFGVGVWFD
ncbi:membrane protein YqaA with SNARE-associated domain [Nocardioides luteus]|uniref:DedA family protein n=1 Tax=Nocardioides luteus TaxID=1844 RepID=A0ABQ5T0X8_9ACTN|nr:hypothetical protein [Nocardioides luteus]MDR7312573.1 membrane protein YqaA with SNARE-associated domain [Nocardioides luteus]GGR45977.1 hypothetical protein GCM10010197_09570 [Nocardioides luteus]GLJ68821.1 hypothetical protein GCM10017579_28570 [Nocardioides luteus]